MGENIIKHNFASFKKFVNMMQYFKNIQNPVNCKRNLKIGIMYKADYKNSECMHMYQL